MQELNLSKIAILRYSFIFDAAKTWQHGYQFEKTFRDYLESIGLKAEIISPSGNAADRVLYICPIEVTYKEKPQKLVSPKDALLEAKRKAGA